MNNSWSFAKNIALSTTFQAWSIEVILILIWTYYQSIKELITTPKTIG